MTWPRFALLATCLAGSYGLARIVVHDDAWANVVAWVVGLAVFAGALEARRRLRDRRHERALVDRLNRL